MCLVKDVSLYTYHDKEITVSWWILYCCRLLLLNFVAAKMKKIEDKEEGGQNHGKRDSQMEIMVAMSNIQYLANEFKATAHNVVKLSNSKDMDSPVCYTDNMIHRYFTLYTESGICACFVLLLCLKNTWYDVLNLLKYCFRLDKGAHIKLVIVCKLAVATWHWS